MEKKKMHHSITFSSTAANVHFSCKIHEKDKFRDLFGGADCSIVLLQICSDGKVLLGDKCCSGMAEFPSVYIFISPNSLFFNDDWLGAAFV